MGFLPSLATTYMGCGLLLIRGLLLCLGGFLLAEFGLAAGRRRQVFSGSFWLTFREYARYRIKRVWPLLTVAAGLILLIWGLVFLFQWILAFYAARFGHPLS